MSNQLEAIDLSNLDAVHGGQGEQRSANIGVQVPTPRGPVQVGVQGAQSQSDYAKCVTAVSGMPGAKPADIRAACGLPSGGN